VTQFFETLFYRPQWYHWIIAILLLPFSLVYGIGMWLRRKLTKRKQYAVPIVSVGNLIIGGSGKTPFVIALAKHFADRKVAIVSRGYGRQSSGMRVVSRVGEVLVSVEESGDEAMLMALKSPHASVIVSEKREEGIVLAIAQGAGLILLDDGFNRVEIEKFEILLEPIRMPNRLPLPSGPLREFLFTRNWADLMLREGEDFERKVSYEGLAERMVLVTAIANPQRLDSFLPEGVIARVYLDDHAYFEASMLEDILQKYQADTLLITEKDQVKMRGLNLPLSLLKLKLELNEGIMPQIESYIRRDRESKT